MSDEFRIKKISEVNSEPYYAIKDKQIKALERDLKWTQRLLKTQERANVILVEKDSELRALLDKHNISHKHIK